MDHSVGLRLNYTQLALILFSQFFAIYDCIRASWGKRPGSLCDLNVVYVRYRTVWSGTSFYQLQQCGN